MFTPTATSAMVSGAVLRVMVWVAAEHVDEVPYVRELVSTEKIKAWINDRKQLALIITSDRVSCRRRQAEEIRGKEQAAEYLKELGVNNRSHLLKTLRPVQTFDGIATW